MKWRFMSKLISSHYSKMVEEEREGGMKMVESVSQEIILKYDKQLTKTKKQLKLANKRIEEEIQKRKALVLMKYWLIGRFG